MKTYHETSLTELSLSAAPVLELNTDKCVSQIEPIGKTSSSV